MMSLTVITRRSNEELEAGSNFSSELGYCGSELINPCALKEEVSRMTSFVAHIISV